MAHERSYCWCPPAILRPIVLRMTPPRENMFNISSCWTSGPVRDMLQRLKNQGCLTTYPAGHRAAVKKGIIDSARELFNRHGFENVSLYQIMAGVDLTHGGFYSYFKSKSDLYAEVLGRFFTDPEWKSCWEGVQIQACRRYGSCRFIRNDVPRSLVARPGPVHTLYVTPSIVTVPTLER
jgi:hypothetical protein